MRHRLGLLVLCSLVACGKVSAVTDGPTSSVDSAAGMVTVTVAKAGNSTGSVTSTPAGIDCGSTCSMTVAVGTQVALTAAPDAAAAFEGWSGGGCSGTGACTITATADTTVTASFTIKTYALTVVKSGGGAGTVISDVGGIDCGATCAASFTPGSVVTLTATPGTGSLFAGWSGGGCSGTGTCVVTVAAATTVTASFTSCTNTTTSLTATQSVSIDYAFASGGNVYQDNLTRAYRNPTGGCGTGGTGCDITGWFEFDLSSIPSSATLVSMKLNAYAETVQMSPTVRVQYSSANNWARASATETGLPITNPQVATAIAPTLSAYNAFTIDMSSQSFAADLADKSLTLGVENTNALYSYAYFTGATSGNLPSLSVTYCH